MLALQSLALYLAGAEPQLVRPVATLAAGSWTASGAATLHAATNEAVASDAEYALSPVNPEGAAALLELGDLEEPEAGDVILRVRYRKDA